MVAAPTESGLVEPALPDAMDLGEQLPSTSMAEEANDGSVSDCRAAGQPA
jgi:hypothetical protein